LAIISHHINANNGVALLFITYDQYELWMALHAILKRDFCSNMHGLCIRNQFGHNKDDSTLDIFPFLPIDNQISQCL
jgi:hypothetical protein